MYKRQDGKRVSLEAVAVAAAAAAADAGTTAIVPVKEALAGGEGTAAGGELAKPVRNTWRTINRVRRYRLESFDMMKT